MLFRSEILEIFDVISIHRVVAAVVSSRRRRVSTGSGMDTPPMESRGLISTMITRERGSVTAALALRKIRHAMLFVINILKVASETRAEGGSEES